MPFWEGLESNQLYNMLKISALIIAKNEEEMIGPCIECLQWCDEVIVLDSGSTDNTIKIAESKGANVISFSHPSFSRLREEALKQSTGDWVIYIDADERVTPKLAREIQVNIETNQAGALSLNRENYHFGQKFSYGGWGNEQIVRVFDKNKIKGWSGEVHESPVFDGNVVALKIPLIHLTHRSIKDGLLKTAAWTPIEAKLIAESIEKSGGKKVSQLGILKKGVMEFIRRYIFKKGYKDGVPGFMESVVQGINKILVYMQVWELQQKPSIREKYRDIEEQIAKNWDSEK